MKLQEKENIKSELETIDNKLEYLYSIIEDLRSQQKGILWFVKKLGYVDPRKYDPDALRDIDYYGEKIESKEVKQ